MEGFYYLEKMSTHITNELTSGSSGEGTDVATGAIKFDSTGEKYAFRPTMPVDIVRWGIMVTETLDVGARLTVVADFRPTAGSTSGEVAGEAEGGAGVIDLGTSAIPSQTLGDVAAGTGVYNDLVSSAGVTLQAAAADQTKTSVPFELDPGEELVFAVDNAADTNGAGYMFVHYIPRGFHDNSNEATKTPTAAGTALTTNRAGHMVKPANVA